MKIGRCFAVQNVEHFVVVDVISMYTFKSNLGKHMGREVIERNNDRLGCGTETLVWVY